MSVKRKLVADVVALGAIVAMGFVVWAADRWERRQRSRVPDPKRRPADWPRTQSTPWGQA